MVQKFISKWEKHKSDNEKRKESLNKKFKEKQNQKKLIKNALSINEAGKSKKIVFNAENSDKSESEDEKLNGNEYNSFDRSKSEDKPLLFNESDNDEEQYEIKVKSQFEGKKGHKLLNLQSKYNNDDRFKLDERFQDDDDADDADDSNIRSKVRDFIETSYEENGAKNLNVSELQQERAKQLKVLGDVLGQSFPVTEKKEKQSRKGFFEMVRFDASNEEHRRHDISNEKAEEKEEEGETVKRKKMKLDKEERKKKEEEGIKQKKKEKDEETDVTIVKKDQKFYHVSDDLKAVLKNRKGENSEFSLLAAFSRKGDTINENENLMETDDGQPQTMKYKIEDGEFHDQDVIVKEKEKDIEAEGKKFEWIKKEKFFMTEKDPRFEEGLTFMNMKDSEEARRAAENYDSTRRDIREVLRLRWQKHRQINNPFKKKIGGSKKQNLSFKKK